MNVLATLSLVLAVVLGHIFQQCVTIKGMNKLVDDLNQTEFRRIDYEGNSNDAVCRMLRIQSLPSHVWPEHCEAL